VVEETLANKSFLFATLAPQDELYGLLWLETDSEHGWTSSQHRDFALAALVLGQALGRSESATIWNRWIDRVRRQQRLETAGRLVGRVIHDFNNILTGIVGFTELSLGQLPQGSPAHAMIREAYQATQQGTQLINQLTFLGKRSTPDSQPVSLAAVVEAERRRLEDTWSEGIELQVELADDLPCLAIDVESLRLVLAHLLENAREAAGSTGTVFLSAQRRELTAADCLDLFGRAAPGQHIEIRIADTGAGFSADARERVLAEPFFSTKPRHRGLGLPSVVSTLSLYHGGLRLEHGGDKGTAVSVYLPVSGPQTPTLSIRRSRLPLAQGEKLLVVDDDPLTLQLMCTTLERAGYRVQPATDGPQALDSFASAAEPFRLVLSDVVMPRMTGFDLAQRLLDHDPQVQVLFTSGHVPAGFLPEDLAGRHFDLLPKPFRPEGLLRAVRAALDRAPSLAGCAQNSCEQKMRS
jgi:signal transduction histidine kinase/CheY-like chemotaxis protein